MFMFSGVLHRDSYRKKIR